MVKKKDILTINGKDEKSFLAEYNHDYTSVSKVGLTWADLVSIHDYYQGVVKNKLEVVAQAVFLDLKSLGGAHTVKYRIKDPEHLIDKIIRKKQADKKRSITIDTFLEEFDDLIGFRILHLFKTDWESIYITLKNRYECAETPVAYHRIGDDEVFISRCKDLGLEVVEKEAGYRSIHYIAKIPFLKTFFKCEIQIRTIFEEAWSEIDHLVRYPNNTNNELLNRYLLMFNRLAGCADDMGVFLMTMKNSLAQQQSERSKLEEVVAQLQDEVSKLKGKNEKQNKKIDDLLERLNKSVETVWPDSLQSILQSTPSYTDYISQIQSPSGSSFYSPITGLPVSPSAVIHPIVDTNPTARLTSLRSTDPSVLSALGVANESAYPGSLNPVKPGSGNYMDWLRPLGSSIDDTLAYSPISGIDPYGRIDPDKSEEKE